MSRSYRGSKGDGYEYWKSRCPKKKMEWHPGRETKKYTHKVERQKNKEVLDEEQSYSDIDNYLDDEQWLL